MFSAPGTASVRLLWPLLALARKRGQSVERLVRERLRLSESQLNDGTTRVSLDLLAPLLEDAIARSGERDLGLLAARFVDNLRIGDRPAQKERTLREVLDNDARHLQRLSDDVQPSLEVDDRVATWRCTVTSELAVHEAVFEFLAALFILRARRITGREDLAPLEVHFAHARPASTRRHEKLFRCRLRFGAPESRVLLSSAALDYPSVHVRPDLRDFSEPQSDRIFEPRYRVPDTVSHVRSLLDAEADLAATTAPQIAQRLGISVRTLSRRLRDEGTSYRNLLDNARRQAATRELMQSTRPIQEIALTLGFASGQSFHRAFRRWTGTSAARFRQHAQSRTPELSAPEP